MKKIVEVLQKDLVVGDEYYDMHPDEGVSIEVGSTKYEYVKPEKLVFVNQDSRFLYFKPTIGNKSKYGLNSRGEVAFPLHIGSLYKEVKK